MTVVVQNYRTLRVEGLDDGEFFRYIFVAEGDGAMGLLAIEVRSRSEAVFIFDGTK